MNTLKFTRGVSATALALAIATIGHASAAWAQDAAPAATPAADAPVTAADAATADAASSGEEIVVTGSRLSRAGYDSPTPVNVVGDERLKQLAIPNVADALNQIPSFRPISSPSSNFFRVSGNIGARTMDLRGLGATRTLVLVDGRRIVPSSDNGTVDLNGIPSALVKRAEVVTGGASAAYGANAVSGVVNLILDSKLNGIKTDMNFGISQRGDAKNFFASVAGGTDFAGGRGHVVAGVEFSKEYGIGPCETRAFCGKYTNYIQNPGYDTRTNKSTNGLPATLVLDNVLFVENPAGVLVTATKRVGNTNTTLGQQVINTGGTLPTALQGKQFDVNGNLVPFQFGGYLSGLFMQGGDPSVTQGALLGLGPQPLIVPTEHVSGMVHADYDVTDTITASAEFMYSHVKGGPTRSSVAFFNPANITLDNPYLSQATVNTILAADPAITALQVNAAKTETGPNSVSISKNDTYRGVLGLKGKLFGDWDWDTSYEYGETDGRLDINNVRLKTINSAIDVVRTGAPAVGLLPATPSLASAGIPDGTIVCRSTLTKPTDGCVPLNILGNNSVSQAALNAYFRPEWQTRKYTQHAIAINLRGSAFDTWAGPVKVAVGGEWRRDTARGDVDAITMAPFLNPSDPTLGFVSPSAVPLGYFKTTVLEGYLEASVPLLKDSALGKQFDIDGAVRRTHYNLFGNATTWKIGGVYAPISDITFRVTRSRDIRAPTATEANPFFTSIQLPLADPFVGGTSQQTVVTGGNPNLKLERGDTFTAGVVLKPSFIRRFNLSLDYYNIKVKGAIDTLTPSQIATACKVQNLLCDLITFAGTPKQSAITKVVATYQNLNQLHAEGFELVADYSLPVLSGNLSFQLNGNYVVDLSTTGATGLVTQFDGWTGNPGSITNIQGVPRWKLDGVITYSRDTWSLTAHGRYIPKGILDNTKIGPDDPNYSIDAANSISTNSVASRFYLDLSGTFKVTETRGDGKVEMYWAVNNVFDKQEPATLRLIGNPLNFDPIGRAFRVGVRTTW